MEKTRIVALCAGDEVENTIVVADGDEGAKFVEQLLKEPVCVRYVAREDGSVEEEAISPSVAIDVSDLKPTERPAPGWRWSKEGGADPKALSRKQKEKPPEDLPIDEK